MSSARRRHSGSPPAKRRSGSAKSAAKAEFHELVAQAVAGLPEPFRSRMENVAIVVQEEPDAGLLRRLGMGSDETLLGYYEGIPLPERGDSYNLVVPDRILIFSRPILESARTAEEIENQVRITIIHEVAHYYGIDDAELERTDYW